MEQLKREWQTDPKIQQLIQAIKDNPASHPNFNWDQDQLRYKGRLWLSSNSDLKPAILQEAHDSPSGGHSGVKKTLERIKPFNGKKSTRMYVVMWLPVMYVRKIRWKILQHLDYYNPCPYQSKFGSDISMDFIEGLPKSHGKDVIFVVVDRLSKYAHIVAPSHPYTAQDVAQAFMETVYKLHGMPNTIVSDRDPIFTSKFWQELFQIQGTKLHMSSAYHPQSDSQTEIVNKCLA